MRTATKKRYDELGTGLSTLTGGSKTNGKVAIVVSWICGAAMLTIFKMQGW